MTSLARTSLIAVCLATAVASTASTPSIAIANDAAQQTATIENNPLLAKWTAPFGAPPFDQIKAKHFRPAFEQAIATHQAQIDAIADNSEAPTFENTIVALERAGADLNRVERVFGALISSVSNDKLRAIQSEMSPRLAAHSSAIALNQDLFARIDALQSNAQRLNLTPEQARVLERTHTSFVRAGAKLSPKNRARLGEIAEQLASLYTAFSQNVQKDAEQFVLVLDAPQKRAGLPQSVLDAAAQAASERDMDGQYVITLARSSFEPFMTFSTRRDLRKQLFQAWTNRGDRLNEFSNLENIKQILQLRLERAQLLGYDNFAAFRTDNTMAGTPQAAHDLLSQVWAGALAKAEQEAKQVAEIMDKRGIHHELKPWDWWYFSEQARADLYELDEQAVKAHLSLDNVLKAQFAVANRLFGLSFEEREDIPVYHPDVRVWEVKAPDGEALGLFYGDYFAKPGKRSGAWMSALRVQHKLDGEVKPLIMNNCNYNKPPPGQPALISMGEAEVVFHEFGHALHGLLSNVTHPSLSGTAVDYDFVEFPAQIFEHWMRQPEVIQEFALHHETKEPMPDHLIKDLRAAANATSGFDNVEYIASAFVDLAYHRLSDPADIETLDVNSFEDGVLTQAGKPPFIAMRHRSPHFLHSFSGEMYAGGYYTYMWAGVLDNDGFAAFEEAGDIFDPVLAKRLYDSVYSAGNSQAAMEAYIDFRGREPSVEPLLKNRGLKVEAD